MNEEVSFEDYVQVNTYKLIIQNSTWDSISKIRVFN